MPLVQLMQLRPFSSRGLGWLACVLLLAACAHSNRGTTVGFPGARQDHFPARPGTYDLREDVDDSPDFQNGNYEPFPGALEPEEGEGTRLR